jgi:hypothetical protein
MESKMSETMKFYHGKNHDMWTKGCIPLGQFVTMDKDSKRKHKLDLGVWLNPNNGNPSFAIVFGKEGNQYISGSLSHHLELDKHAPINDYFLETIKRYNKHLDEKKDDE